MRKTKQLNQPHRRTRAWQARRRLIRLSAWLLAGGLGFFAAAGWLWVCEPAQPWAAVIAAAAGVWSFTAAIRLEGTLWNLPMDCADVAPLYRAAKWAAEDRRAADARAQLPQLPATDAEFTQEDEALLRVPALKQTA